MLNIIYILMECYICFEEKYKYVILECEHSMCQDCCNKMQKIIKCPFCRKNSVDIQKHFIYERCDDMMKNVKFLLKNEEYDEIINEINKATINDLINIRYYLCCCDFYNSNMVHYCELRLNKEKEYMLSQTSFYLTKCLIDYGELFNGEREKIIKIIIDSDKKELQKIYDAYHDKLPFNESSIIQDALITKNKVRSKSKKIKCMIYFQ